MLAYFAPPFVQPQRLHYPQRYRLTQHLVALVEPFRTDYARR